MTYPTQALGTFLTRREDWITIDNTVFYNRARVQLHGRGIVLRDRVEGTIIRTKKQQVAHAGQFLVAEIDAKVGGIGMVPSELEGAIVSSHYFLFDVDESECLGKWLDAFVRSGLLEGQVVARGSTNYAAIRPHHVSTFEIPLPPLPEQRRIVEQIDRLASRISEARSLRDQTAQETAAVLQAHARSMIEDVRAEQFPLSRWLDTTREGIQTGPFGAQLSSADFTESGVPVLTIGNVQYTGLDTRALRFVSQEKAEALSRYALRDGDLLFARMGTVGRCCIVPPEAAGWLMNYHIIRVALDSRRVTPRFIFWTIRASAEIESYLERTIRGATRQGVNSKIVGGLPCRVPPMTEQRRIVGQLDALQARIGEVTRFQSETAAELDALLPSILDKAFKGEL